MCEKNLKTDPYPGLDSAAILICKTVISVLGDRLENIKSMEGDANMAQAKSGDTVKVHYKGTLPDGTIFDSSEGRDPLEFKIGEGNLIPGVEEAVIGMKPEEVRTATVPPEKGYGDYKEEMVVDVEKTQFPENIDPTVGQQLELKQPDGQTVVVTVTDIADDTVKLDANHPLAGKDLIFELQLVDIV